MHIEERKITVREVTEGYFNDAEEGVVGYDEQLDIRPKYQRECRRFVQILISYSETSFALKLIAKNAQLQKIQRTFCCS